MAKHTRTNFTELMDGLRDDAKRLRDALSDELNRLFVGDKATKLQLADSATTEETGAVFDAHDAPSLWRAASTPLWPR